MYKKSRKRRFPDTWESYPKWKKYFLILRELSNWDENILLNYKNIHFPSVIEDKNKITMIRNMAKCLNLDEPLNFPITDNTIRIPLFLNSISFSIQRDILRCLDKRQIKCLANALGIIINDEFTLVDYILKRNNPLYEYNDNVDHINKISNNKQTVNSYENELKILETYDKNTLIAKAVECNAVTKGCTTKRSYIAAIIKHKYNIVIEAPEKKDKISRDLKNNCWKKKFGEYKTGICECCATPISIDDFTASHILSEFHKGDTKIENLIPTCKTCSSSMGTMFLYEFIFVKGYEKRKERDYRDPNLLLGQSLFILDKLNNNKKILDKKKSPSERLNYFNNL